MRLEVRVVPHEFERETVMSDAGKAKAQTQAKTSTTKDTATKAADMPEEVKAVAEKSVEQAREALEKVNTAANENVKVFDETATALKDGTSEFQVKMVEMAQANLDAGFEHARKLMSAKDPKTAFELQEAFLRDRAQTMTRQMQELGTMSMQLAETVAKPMQDSVTKSFDEMRKTFTL